MFEPFSLMSISLNPSDYSKKEIIGQGSFGVVSKAQNKNNDQTIAIKEIDISHGQEEIGGLQENMESILNCSSEFLARYYGCATVGSKLWIFMEYFNCGSVLDRIKAKRMSEKQIAAVASQILKGIAALHATSRIHRDIKAANILLNDAGEAKLADYGIGNALENVAMASAFSGTAAWMAPEVVGEDNYSDKCDIWSLGITIIEMANGVPPFSGKKPFQIFQLIKKGNPPSLEGEFSDDMKDFVRQCLNKDPSRRPSAEELARHPFVASAGGKEVVAEYVSEVSAQGRDGK